MKKKLLIACLPLIIPCLTGCSSSDNIKKIVFIDDNISTRIRHTIDFENGYYYQDLLNTYYNGITGEIENRYCQKIPEKDAAKMTKIINGLNFKDIKECYGLPKSEFDFRWSFNIEYNNGTNFSTKNYLYYSEVIDDFTFYDTFSKLETCFNKYLSFPIVDETTSGMPNRTIDKQFKNRYVDDLFEIRQKNLEYIQHGIYFIKEEANKSFEEHTRTDANLYEINLKNKNNNLFSWEDYIFVSNFRTVYDLESATLTSYDFNPELTNKKEIVHEEAKTDFEYYNDEILTYKSLNQINVDLEPNKIYVLNVTYSDKDYFEITFNTYVTDRKIICGRYEANPENYFGVLDLNEDGTFAYQFFKEGSHRRYYLGKRDYLYTDAVEDKKYVGTYRFETFDGVDELVLDMGEEGTLAYKYDSYNFLKGDALNSSFTYMENDTTASYGDFYPYTLRLIRSEDIFHL